ncbi:MAG: hypothetical protein U0V87_14275 [Acidobacteriota bacterium]
MHALRLPILLGAMAIMAAGTLGAAEEQKPAAPAASPEAKPADNDPKNFRPDPSYVDKSYDASAQLQIYGGKYANLTQRPLLELGREMYAAGPLKPATSTLFGRKNPMNQQFIAHGDFQLGTGWNQVGDKDSSRLAARLNLDMDWRFTSTERIHAFARPLDKEGRFLSYDYQNSNADFTRSFDGNLDALFFEGELGAMLQGWRDKPSKFDLPFAVGFMPLLLQNGVWLEDAFTGLAFTIPARNSRKLDISNADITFFVGLDRVSSRATIAKNQDPRVAGVAIFAEANQGYWEIDYGYTEDVKSGPDRSYHNVGLAFTRRYGNWLSNSVRVIGNFGQEEPTAGVRTADGALLLIENSFITHKPLTLVPYLNLFVGIDSPQSLARDPGAGGILKNTGLLFEGNALTGLASMESSGNNTWGGAFGVEYLFGLDRQLVVELAALQTSGDITERIAKDDQYGLGIRYQMKLSHNMIVRFDGMYADRGIEDSLAGVRAEWRIKF